MKRVTIGCVVGIALVFGGAGTAFAGETNGNGDPIPANLRRFGGLLGSAHA